MKWKTEMKNFKPIKYLENRIQYNCLKAIGSFNYITFTPLNPIWVKQIFCNLKHYRLSIWQTKHLKSSIKYANFLMLIKPNIPNLNLFFTLNIIKNKRLFNIRIYSNASRYWLKYKQNSIKRNDLNWLKFSIKIWQI